MQPKTSAIEPSEVDDMEPTKTIGLRVSKQEEEPYPSEWKEADSFTFKHVGVMYCYLKNGAMNCDAFERTKKYSYLPVAKATVGGVYVRSSALSWRNEYGYNTGPTSDVEGKIVYPIKKGVTCRMESFGTDVINGLVCSPGKK